MKSWMISIAVMAVLSASNSAPAQESRKLEFEGQEGTWLPQPMALEIQADLAELDRLRISINDIENLSALRLERVENLKLALTASESAEGRSVKAMELALEERDDAKKEIRKWYRHPALWVTVGAVLAVGLVVGAVKVVQSLE